jgi:hypothetical protein
MEERKHDGEDDLGPDERFGISSKLRYYAINEDKELIVDESYGSQTEIGDCSLNKWTGDERLVQISVYMEQDDKMIHKIVITGNQQIPDVNMTSDQVVAAVREMINLEQSAESTLMFLVLKSLEHWKPLVDNLDITPPHRVVYTENTDATGTRKAAVSSERTARYKQINGRTVAKALAGSGAAAAIGVAGHSYYKRRQKLTKLTTARKQDSRNEGLLRAD